MSSKMRFSALMKMTSTGMFLAILASGRPAQAQNTTIPCVSGSTSCSSTSQTVGAPSSSASDTTSQATQSGTSANANGAQVNPTITNQPTQAQSQGDLTESIGPNNQNATGGAGGAGGTATGNTSTNSNQSSASSGGNTTGGNVMSNGSNSGSNILTTGSSTSGGNTLSTGTNTATTGNNTNTTSTGSNENRNTASGGSVSDAGNSSTAVTLGGQTNTGGAQSNTGGAQTVTGGAQTNTGGAQSVTGGAQAVTGGAQTNTGGAQTSSNTNGSNSNGSNSNGQNVGNGVTNVNANTYSNYKAIYIPPVVPSTPASALAIGNIIKSTTACGPLVRVVQKTVIGTFFGLLMNSKIKQGHDDQVETILDEHGSPTWHDVPVNDGRGTGIQRWGDQVTMFTTVLGLAGARNVAIGGGGSNGGWGQGGMGTSGSIQQMVTTVQVMPCDMGAYITPREPIAEISHIHQ